MPYDILGWINQEFYRISREEYNRFYHIQHLYNKNILQSNDSSKRILSILDRPIKNNDNDYNNDYYNKYLRVMKWWDSKDKEYKFNSSYNLTNNKVYQRHLFLKKLEE